jgi:hypothetical protein
MRAEGFSCSLGVLCGGLGISKLQFLQFPAVILFTILGHQTLDPDPGSRGSGSAIRKNSGFESGSALNQCGSATLLRSRSLKCSPSRRSDTE